MCAVSLRISVIFSHSVSLKTMNISDTNSGTDELEEEEEQTRTRVEYVLKMVDELLDPFEYVTWQSPSLPPRLYASLSQIVTAEEYVVIATAYAAFRRRRIGCFE